VRLPCPVRVVRRGNFVDPSARADEPARDRSPGRTGHHPAGPRGVACAVIPPGSLTRTRHCREIRRTGVGPGAQPCRVGRRWTTQVPRTTSPHGAAPGPDGSRTACGRTDGKGRPGRWTTGVETVTDSGSAATANGAPVSPR
jgi:hypothetical protein